jgi:tRNA-binding EMAP/Myf-like protein
MRVPLSWLKEYVDFDMSPEALAHMMTMAGLEVEAIEYIGQAWGDKVITAQIIHLEKIEKSDHLSYTRVITGSGELGVVCGASNIKEGDKVPLALPGAQIGDITISESRKMGYVSQGMLCSARELGLGSDHAGIYILARRATGRSARRGRLRLLDQSTPGRPFVNHRHCPRSLRLDREAVAHTRDCHCRAGPTGFRDGTH